MAETEYFLVASYSCLSTVFTDLERARACGQDAVVFCLARPLFDFLRDLPANWSAAQVHYVDTRPITGLSLRWPANWWRVRRGLERTYDEWFKDIPAGSTVHFYNGLAALFLFYVVWRLSRRCSMHYTQCDPLELYTRDRSLRGAMQWMVLRLGFPVPFQMVSMETRRSVRFPAVTEGYLAQVADVRSLRPRTVAQLRKTELYWANCWRSRARVLWVMGLLLDTSQVVEDPYRELVRQCAKAVERLVGPELQAVKFHPRAREHENAWSKQTERIPGHIPAEFVELPDLQVVLTVSSTSVSAFSMTSSVRVVSLVDLVPFVDADARCAHRSFLQHVAAGSDVSVPQTMRQLEGCLAAALGPCHRR